MAEQYGVHNPAGEEGECPGDGQRARKYGNHGPLVTLDPTCAGEIDGERQHNQCENRKEMNGAPRTPDPEFMDEESA
jgi:hypothetical protein